MVDLVFSVPREWDESEKGTDWEQTIGVLY